MTTYSQHLLVIVGDLWLKLAMNLPLINNNDVKPSKLTQAIACFYLLPVQQRGLYSSPREKIYMLSWFRKPEILTFQ